MRQLLEIAADHYQRYPHPTGALIADALRNVMDKELKTFEPGPWPLAFQELNAVQNTSHTQDLLEVVQAQISACEWLVDNERLTSYMTDRHAIAHIIGPDGLIPSETFRFGLFFMSANTMYPLHAHSAEELYYVVSGTALWRTEAVRYEPQPPGCFVHHAAWQPHATRTQAEPLLACWVWLGDIRMETYQIDPRGFDAEGKPV